MFALERIRIIKKYLDEHRQAEVNTLSTLLGVSEVTVRRDLEKLETEGYLTRTHGGALLNAPQEPQVPVPEEAADIERCEEIADVARAMIHDDDVIMLSSGNINLRIARKLDSLSNVTILTNDTRIALALASQQQNRTVLLGGDLDHGTGALFGAMTIENLQKFYVNRLFFEVDGVSDQLQLTVSNQEKATLIREALPMARERIAMCLADRFEHGAFYRLGGIDIATRIITNPELLDVYKNRIFMNNIPLFTSINAFEGTV